MIEGAVQSPHYLPEQAVIIHSMPHSVQHITCFGIHIAAALVVHIIMRNDRTVVANASAYAGIVCIGGVFSEYMIDEQSLAVIGKTFMDIHIRQVFTGDVITEPF